MSLKLIGILCRHINHRIALECLRNHGQRSCCMGHYQQLALWSLKYAYDSNLDSVLEFSLSSRDVFNILIKSFLISPSRMVFFFKLRIWLFRSIWSSGLSKWIFRQNMCLLIYSRKILLREREREQCYCDCCPLNALLVLQNGSGLLSLSFLFFHILNHLEKKI